MVLTGQKEEYFIRIPNKYIQCNIKKNLGLSRKFYAVYILINKYRSFENYSWITIRKILTYYGFPAIDKIKNKPKAYYEIIDILNYMINNEMILVSNSLDNISYDTGIEIKINPRKFDTYKNFTIITSSEFDKIMLSKDLDVNKDNLLLSFLYIKSCIWQRPKDSSGRELLGNPSINPEAFFKNLYAMSSELEMSRNTISKCIDFLVKLELLVRKSTGSICFNDKDLPRNIPNIYAMNKNGYKQETEWAYKKLLKYYNVTEFGEIKKKKIIKLQRRKEM